MLRQPTSRRVTLLLSLLVGCGDAGSGGTTAAPRGVEAAKSALTRVSTPSTANVTTLGADNQTFAFDLLHALAKDHAGENLLFSPYSISTALAMAYEGARTATASEMQTTLHFSLERAALHEAFNATDLALASRGAGAVGADGTPFRLLVDNSLWMQRDFAVVPAYLDVLALNYGAGVYRVDFASDSEGARASINAWVSDKTDKLIPELLPVNSVSPATELVLTNTVYFNASWQTKFDAQQTRAAPFSKLDGSQISVPMMNAMGLDIPYAEGVGYRAISLPYATVPYAGSDLSLIAVLPDDGSYQTLEASADAAWFQALRAQLQITSVGLSFPKLDYQAKASLGQELQALGMVSAFGHADFSGMTPAPVYIDNVMHRAVIKLFEGGTIAAAATEVSFTTLSIKLNAQTISFDRPFLFAIYDVPTGSLLFLGRVLDPSAM